MDAEGNRGVSTPVASFNWLWPSATATQLEDLNPAPEAYDPRFSWNPIPGAARYEVEVNSSSDFTPGSKVCCDGATIATSISPTEVLKDNVFYWRVRALDPDGNAGVWNYGGSVHEDVRQGRAGGPGHRHEHQERAHARQSRRPGRRRRHRTPPATRRACRSCAGTPCPARPATRSRSPPWTGAICDWGIREPLHQEDRRARSGRRSGTSSATPSPGRGRSPRTRRSSCRGSTACASARAADRAAGEPGGLGRLHVPLERQHGHVRGGRRGVRRGRTTPTRPTCRRRPAA